MNESNSCFFFQPKIITVKISQIRLERLNLIQKEKDAMNLNENSIRNLYDSLKLEQEIRGEDAPLNSVS